MNTSTDGTKLEAANFHKVDCICGSLILHFLNQFSGLLTGLVVLTITVIKKESGSDFFMASLVSIAGNN